MRLTKDESEINLASGEVDPEFSEWKWANPEDVIEQVCSKLDKATTTIIMVSLRYRRLNMGINEQAVDYKRPTYEEVMRTFRSYLGVNNTPAKCQSTKW